MKRKIIATMSMAAVALFISSCGGNSSSSQSGSTTSQQQTTANTSDYDPNRGEGKFDETNTLINGLDAAMAAKGKAVSETKCFSCHKTSNEKLVGPGWKGVTERRTPHWILNFITNPDPMIDKDPEVQAQLELCLVRMPNQNLSDDEARSIVEYMRENDGAN